MVLFALLALVIIPLSGGAVDYAGALAARERLVAAADAAALAIASQNVTEQADANTMAEALALAHYPTAERGTVTVSAPTVSFDGNRVTVTIDGGFQTSFLPLIGITTLSVGATAEAVKNRKLDIVMVVQTSHAFSVNLGDVKDELVRFRKLVLANQGDGSVQVGLVPFAASVNVGRNASYPWIDDSGESVLNTVDIDLSPGRSLLDLYDDIEGDNPVSDHDALIVPHPHKGNAWGGCVRARKTPSDIQDVGHEIEPWVALFAPDNHVSPRSIRVDRPGQSPPYEYRRREIANEEVWDRLFGIGKPTGNEIVEKVADWVSLYRGRRVDDRMREVNADGSLVLAADSKVPTDQELRAEFYNLRRASNDYLPGSSRHSRSETRYRAEDLKPNPANWSWFRLPSPNRGCVGAPIQPLTPIPADVDRSIHNMIAGGNTITTVGMAWGWRVLSPGLPYNEAQTGNDVDRAIILFSDGKNFPGNSFSAYGGTTVAEGLHPSKEQLDARLATLCANIKQSDLGITVYTVNFASLETKESNLLKNCASTTCKGGAGSCNYASDGDSMDDVFREIANEVTKVRLSR